MNKNHGNTSGKIRAGLAGTCICVSLLPGQAAANPDDPYKFIAGVSSTYDSNLFRLPDGVATPVAGKPSRSETMYATYAGVRVDKPYSLQRLQLEVTGTRYEYQTFDYLNFTAFDYRAAWQWSLTPDLTGSISADRKQALVSYADFINPSQRNVQTVENRRAALDWRASGGWHLLGAATEMKLRNSTSFLAVGDFTQDSAEAGVQYVAASNSALAIVQREGRGEYRNRPLDVFNQLDTHYKQSETELQGRWLLTGKSTVDGRVAWLKRTHDNFPERDFSGPVGQLRYLWTPTAKLQFTALAGRDLYSYQENNPAYPSSYFVNKYASLTPAWQLTEKTSLRLRLEAGKRQFEGATVPAVVMREDRFKLAQFGVTWNLSRSLEVIGTLSHERRNSNIETLTYRDNTALLSLALKF